MTAVPHPTLDEEGVAAIISSGADRLGIDLDTLQVDRLMAYLRMIERWNATYNLTAIHGLSAMASQHIVDSLAAIPKLRSLLGRREDGHILDVGSGAGLPGVVIAIVEPHVQVACVDSVGKKAAFITQVAATLSLGNLKAVHSRVERILPPPAYDVIVSRAYASLADFVKSTRHLLAPDGWWLAMKARVSEDELSESAVLGVAFTGSTIEVPGLDAERRLLCARNPAVQEQPLASEPRAAP